MPHIIFHKNKLISTPSNFDGVDFEFIAEPYTTQSMKKKDEYKISVKNENKNFLLNLKDRKNDYLLKFDKPTRVTPISLVKKALNSYAKANKEKIISSNTNNENKQELQNEYLKDISFFVDEFKTDKDLQIEIGFGSARHLLHQAVKYPDKQFIGLEIHTPSIEQLLRQLKLQDIKNILVVNYDARLLMEFIQSNSVEKIFVHFPVPWDKKPHRRVYSTEFINEALRVLKAKGTLELRTDSRKYFDYCLNLLTNLPKGKINIDINKNLEVSSKYEDRWKKQGKNIYDVILESYSTDKDINLDFDFNFDFNINLKQTLEKLEIKPFVKKDFFIHFEDFFIINNWKNSGLIKLTLGNFDRPITKYLLIKEGNISYYQGKPLATSSNKKAHKLLSEILKND